MSRRNARKGTDQGELQPCAAGRSRWPSPPPSSPPSARPPPPRPRRRTDADRRPTAEATAAERPPRRIRGRIDGTEGTIPDPAECAAGLTLDEGVLTVATGEPAFPPYVIDDDAHERRGFRGGRRLCGGRARWVSRPTRSTWVRTPFEAAIQPGPKDFDFNLQQYSITPEREEVVSFSLPYYTSTHAIVAFADTPAAEAATLADLQELQDRRRRPARRASSSSRTSSSHRRRRWCSPTTPPRSPGARDQPDRRDRRRPADRALHHRRPDRERRRGRAVPAGRRGRGRAVGPALREGQPARRVRQLRPRRRCASRVSSTRSPRSGWKRPPKFRSSTSSDARGDGPCRLGCVDARPVARSTSGASGCAARRSRPRRRRSWSDLSSGCVPRRPGWQKVRRSFFDWRRLPADRSARSPRRSGST